MMYHLLLLQLAAPKPTKNMSGSLMSTTKRDSSSRAIKKGEPRTVLKSKLTFTPAGKLEDARSMNANDLKQLAIEFSLIEEVAACLVYEDGSTQLRPNMVSQSIVSTLQWNRKKPKQSVSFNVIN